MGDGNIDVGVENLDLIFEETAVDNVPDNNDVTRETEFLYSMYYVEGQEASYVPSYQYGRSKQNSYGT